jgi:RNA polymerase sigma-70 factor, ECF subfamily
LSVTSVQTRRLGARLRSANRGDEPVDGGFMTTGLPRWLLQFSRDDPLQPFPHPSRLDTTMTSSPCAFPADADIHERLQARQYREAFALLLPRYRDKVFRLTYSMLRTRATAEDITQDVLLRIWRALPGYAGQSSLSTWIYAISRNACLSELRKRRPQVSLDEDEDGVHTEIGTADPDDSATLSVTQLLDQLPERYRQAVVLFYMEDKSYEQTASSLGLPLGTVKALLHRARKRLIELTREAA